MTGREKRKVRHAMQIIELDRERRARAVHADRRAFLARGSLAFLALAGALLLACAVAGGMH